MMLIFLFILFALLVIAPPIKFNEPAKEDYLSKKNTLPIKGLFVILIFMSHSRGYINLSDSFLDQSFSKILGLIGQLMVAFFFFLSGYGIFKSHKTKKNYINSFLFNRFFITWLNLAICLTFFIIMNACLNNNYQPQTILLSFVGWTSIGNSNWFLFVTFAFYIFFYVCFRFKNNGNNDILRLSIFTMLSIGLLVMLFFLKEGYWWDTLLCFPAGMWYAKYKDKIDSIVLKNSKSYFICLIGSIAIFVGSYFLLKLSHGFYCLYSIVFTILITLILMKIRFNSIPLSFIGKHVFSVYVLQRLILTTGKHLSLNKNIYLFFIISLLITILIAFIYDFAFSKLKRFLVETFSKIRHKSA